MKNKSARKSTVSSDRHSEGRKDDRKKGYRKSRSKKSGEKTGRPRADREKTGKSDNREKPASGLSSSCSNIDGTVMVKDVRIGEGMPKICVPIVGRTADEIFNQANQILYSPADVVEWRADHFRRSSDIPAVLSALRKLESRLEGRPILFTFRTAKEGGERHISLREYAALYESVISSGLADLIDIEYSLGKNITDSLISLARSKGVAVILSYHDFHQTPSEEEIVSRLMTMKERGADIAKIAVMPQNPSDVLTLLSATEKMKHMEDPIPVISVSMSAQGMISRISGEIFGSAMTFASAGRTSAPGQIDADQVDRFLSVVHQGNDTRRIKGSPSPNKKNIILIGFMGAGKSTVARRLSQKTGMKVKEMDDMIVQQEGMSIKEIFDRYGEAYFRDVETQQTKIISESSGVIVSCGGGTVMRQQNVDYLRKNGTVILLNASPDTVFERVKRGGDKRPLLNKHMSRGFISYLMKKRSDTYHAVADVVIYTDGMGSDRVADEIIRLMDL